MKISRKVWRKVALNVSVYLTVMAMLFNISYPMVYSFALAIESDSPQEEEIVDPTLEELEETADLSEYKKVLASVDEKDYTADSWEIYQKAVKANEVTEKDSQEDVDAAADKIKETQGDLVEVEEENGQVEKEDEKVSTNVSTKEDDQEEDPGEIKTQFHGASPSEIVADGESSGASEIGDWRENEDGSMTVLVEEGGEYEYKDSGLKIKFTRIDSGTGEITVKEIELTDEQREKLGALSNKAWDITSDMKNGSFEYELTLPTEGNIDESDVKVVYAENKNDLNDESKVKEVEKDDVKVDNDKKEIKADNLDHFTTFVVKWDFPNNPDDNLADDGTSLNKAIKEISGEGGISVDYSHAGDDTYTARATGWDNGKDLKYWMIEFDSTGYESLKLSSKQRSSNTGPKDFRIEYKIGNGSWLDLGQTIKVADNYTKGKINNKSLPSDCDNQSSVFIRWIMDSNDSVNDGVVGSGGVNNIDDIIVEGSEISDNCSSTGAIWTTDSSCSVVDGNIFNNKSDVFLNGGPQNNNSSGLEDGEYYIKVTTPDGDPLGESSPVTVSVINGQFDHCIDLYDLTNFDNTTNAGGVYKVWASKDENFSNNCSKTDNFKVIPEEESTCEPGEKGWAYAVDENNQGTTKNGVTIPADRSDENKMLGEAVSGDDTDFFSIGKNGSVVLSFEYGAKNVDGDDLSFHETTWGNRVAYGEEKAMVEVAQTLNGPWIGIGEVSNLDDDGEPGMKLLDFDSTGWDWIKYVRITDITDFSHFNNSADGYDLDAMDAVFQLCDEQEPEPEKPEYQCDKTMYAVNNAGMLAWFDFGNKTLEDLDDLDFGSSASADDPFNPRTYYISRYNPSYLKYYDHDTESNENVGPTGIPSNYFTKLAFNIYGQLYGLTDDHKLYQLNTGTGQATLSGAVSGIATGGDIVFDENNELYLIGTDGKLFTVNPVTLVATLVKSTGLKPVTGMAYVGGSFYVSNGSSDIFKMDKNGENIEKITSEKQEVINDLSSCLPGISTAKVKICKEDEDENRLEGWNLQLLGEKVDEVTVKTDGTLAQSIDLGAGDYVLVASGTYQYRGSSGLLTDANFSQRLESDGYSGPYFPWINVNDLSIPGALGIMVNSNPTNWSEYLAVDNIYGLPMKNFAGGKINFSVYDNYYNDNVGDMKVEIYKGYGGVTGEDGCFALEDVPFGDYQLDETLKYNWENVSGLGAVSVDEAEEEFVVTNEDHSPYCGDGIKNQESEQCDGKDGIATDGSEFCTSQCKKIPVYDGNHECPKGNIPWYVTGLTLDSQSSALQNLDLLGGNSYLLQASGSYQYANNSQRKADAAYGTTNNFSTWRPDIGIWGTNRGVTSLLGDLGRGMGVIEWDDDKNINGDHVYSKLVEPGGDLTAHFAISDWYGDWYGNNCDGQGCMGDNSGSLNLDLYQCVEPGSIQGRKYNDVNGNGDFDQNEKTDENRLDGWMITLYNEDFSQEIASMETGDDNTPAGNVEKGQYRFENLSLGTYQVCEELKEGWFQTEPSTGVMHEGQYCHTVELTEPGANIVGIQFGNFKGGAIQGRKYQDNNLDGKHQGPDFEPHLDGWKIRLYQMNEEEIWEQIGSEAITGDNGGSNFDIVEKGQYRFGPLPSGIYYVCEVLQDNWAQTGPPLSTMPVDNNGNNLPGENGLAVANLSGAADEGAVCWQSIISKSDQLNAWHKFGNVPLSEIHGFKWNDINGNGEYDCEDDDCDVCEIFDNLDCGGCCESEESEGEKKIFDFKRNCEEKLAGWEIFIDENGNEEWDEGEKFEITSEELGDYGWYHFKGLLPGKYSVCEVQQTGWSQTFPVETVCHEVTLPDSNGEECQKPQLYNFGNYKYGNLTVTKYNDEDDDGQWDEGEEALSDWEINLEKDAITETKTTDSDGKVLFDNLLAGDYELSENLQPGWEQTNISCDINEDEEAIDNDNNYPISIESGSEVACEIGNQFVESEMFISKTNNGFDSVKKIGDIITYIIKVRAQKNGVNVATVVDLPPETFKYVPGSWTANSDTRGDLSNIGLGLSHVYASPGIWDLGDMQEGEEITLTYQVQIEDGTETGIYPDVAWASGKNLADSELIALSENSDFPVNNGIVDDNYVGTQIEVDNPEEAPTVKVRADKDEVIEEDEVKVKGATTYLPATGANGLWLLISVLGVVLGSLLAGLGVYLKKGNKINFGKGKILGMILGIVFSTLFISNAMADDIAVRVSDPGDKVTESFDLQFVAMDVLGREMTVECQKKGPSDVSFVKFGSDINLQAGGDSDICKVDSSALSGSGDYEFRVIARADGDEKISNIVKTFYDGVGPSKPKYIEKDEVNSCRNKVTFRTANDGQTAYVEIYRSHHTRDIVANEDSRIKTITVGPNEKESFNDSLTSTGCGDNYYYAIRAFDSSGNASGVREEEFEKIIEEEVEVEVPGDVVETATGGEAGTAGTAAEEGRAGGEEIAGETTEEETLQIDEGVQTEEEAEEEAEVLGEQTENGNYWKDWRFWLAIIVLAIIGWQIYKRNKLKKESQEK